MNTHVFQYNVLLCLCPLSVYVCGGGGMCVCVCVLHASNVSPLHPSYGTHGIDFKHALSGREEGIPTIVLAHQPSATLKAIEWKDVGLVLSGRSRKSQFLVATSRSF